MMFVKLITGLIIIASLLGICLLGGSCTATRDFDKRLNSTVKPYRFSIPQWKFNTISDEVNQWASSRHETTDNEVNAVIEYFSFVQRIKSLKSEKKATRAANGLDTYASLVAELNVLEKQKLSLEDLVEIIIQNQIKEILTEQGILNPIDKYIGIKVRFPPINFKLEKLPYLLVISPRDRIESMREITLLQSISLTDMETIEDEIDKLGFSSLVVELGGFGATYPTIVTNDASLRFVIDTAAEEWLHQYLLFKPLGFLYLLDTIGISRNYEIATMNETLASMVSKEIGSQVHEKYYPFPENSNHQNRAGESEFDFNREMREIRRAVDKQLIRGEIEQAEEFMEEKRQYLALMGYHIRKLNQAYFAFYGTYADSPTSISPIGLELRQLRSKSESVKEFLDKVAAMTSRQNLRESIE